MISKVLFWGGFGVAVRAWQLGIEMRPLISAKSKPALYLVYATIGGGIGYWLEGVGERQKKLLADRKEVLLEKRRRKAEIESGGGAGDSAVDETVIVAGS